MGSFGDRLKQERETRGTTIDEVAVATGVDRSYLEALESGNLEALPGRAFGKLYVRAYAEVLGFDPRPLIEEYDREERASRSPSTDPATVPPAEPRRVQAAIARWKESRGAAPPAPKQDEAAEEKSEPVPVEAPREPPVEEPAAAPDETSDLVRRYRAVIDGRPLDAEDRPRAKRRLVVGLILMGLAAALLGAWVSVLRREPERSAASTPSAPAPPKQETPREQPVASPPVVPLAKEEPPAPKPVESPPKTSPATKPVEVEPPPKAPPAPKPTPRVDTTPPASSSLVLSEIGVGGKVARHRLEDEADRFAPGDLVYCATRIRGGKGGQRIRHVWMHEGRTTSTVTLRLGGANWFTYSNKRIGAPGAWVVEVRDESGAVLGSASFTSE